jgi:flagellar M-ring protein FliF
VNSVLQGLKALGPARLVALGAVGLVTLAMVGLLAVRGGGSAQMSLLYADLDLHEAAQITDQLDRAHIPHQEEAQGERILVPAADVARARLLLAKSGLPSGGSIGYEIFDRGDELTASEFQQEINQTRALEGELARSIRALNGVRAARVHLVLPKRQPFSREQQEAQASILLSMAGPARLDPTAVQAVLNLVAAAVPGLRAQNIAVIDSRGNLLARAGQPTGADSAASTAEELRRSTELRLARAVEEMLEQTLGPGHVRAEAAVEMSFDRVNETAESYNPDQQVMRSQQNVTDNSRSTEAEKSVTVQNNLPNADAGQPQSGTQQQRQEETTNYEIGKTVRTLVREQPQIARISLAVMVDGETRTGPDGKALWHPRDAEELERITRLVQSAIGFDPKRGDKVEVQSMRFVEPDLTVAETPSLLQGVLHGENVMGLAQSAFLAAIVMLALVFVLRPMVLRLSTLSGSEETAPALIGPGVAAGSAAGAAALPGVQPQPAAPMLADESMIDLVNVEGQIKASSLRKLAEMVDKHPDESLSIVRSWMSQESARASAECPISAP